MFTAEGWISLRQFTRDAFWAEFHAKHPKVGETPPTEKSSFSLISNDILSDVAPLVWQFLADQTWIGVLTPSGTVVKADRELVAFFLPDELEGIYVDLELGTVGSGDFLRNARLDRRARTEKDLLPSFGAFLYQPVLVREREASDFLRKIGSGGLREAVHPHERVAQRIVDEFDRGARPTKAWARQNLAPDMKALEFMATWKMAAEMRPELSKPGPRGPRDA